MSGVLSSQDESIRRSLCLFAVVVVLNEHWLRPLLDAVLWWWRISAITCDDKQSTMNIANTPYCIALPIDARMRQHLADSEHDLLNI